MPTAELQSHRFSPASAGSQFIEHTEGRIAVFGNRRVGLSGLMPSGWIETKPEATKVVSGLTSADLPDAWQDHCPSASKRIRAEHAMNYHRAHPSKRCTPHIADEKHVERQNEGITIEDRRYV
jgi:hypothetical protein